LKQPIYALLLSKLNKNKEKLSSDILSFDEFIAKFFQNLIDILNFKSKVKFD
jgi:hypothetical protein